MSEQVRQHELAAAIAAALREQAAAEHYRQKQRRARSGKPLETDGARPLEFDESGFPVAQRNASFITRVTRLLGPG
jgi:hypothetical protein